MNEILPFDFEGQPIRVVAIGGVALFVGKDVCDRLGYADATNAMKQHCRGVAKRHPIVDALGRTQEVRVLQEADVLRLVVRSKLKAAERFEQWVFEEVLPAIRKHGGYMVAAPDETPEELALRAMQVLHATVERQKAQIALMQPAVDAHDRIAQAHGSLCLTDAAKGLQVRPKELIDYLSRHGWIYRRHGSDRWVGYQTRTIAGDLEHKVATFLRPDGTEKVTEQVRITPQGLMKLAKHLPPSIRLAA